MDVLKELWPKFFLRLMSVLPLSPFRGWIDYLSAVPYLGYINWFIPMDKILGITVAWTSSILGYYIFSAILRWLKIIA